MGVIYGSGAMGVNHITYGECTEVTGYNGTLVNTSNWTLKREIPLKKF